MKDYSKVLAEKGIQTSSSNRNSLYDYNKVLKNIEKINTLLMQFKVSKIDNFDIAKIEQAIKDSDFDKVQNVRNKFRNMQEIFAKIGDDFDSADALEFFELILLSVENIPLTSQKSEKMQKFCANYFNFLQAQKKNKK